MLLSLPVSAYHASLVADDDALYVLTSSRAYRLSPEGQAADMPLDLGFGATTSSSAFVFWSEGAVFAAPKGGGEARRIVPLAARPELFAASGDELAWLERTDARSAVHGMVKGKAKKLYASPGSLDALAMLGDTAFFVERPGASSWRIGSVRTTSDAQARFTAERTGRAPSMLVARESGLFYYDGNRLEVRRLSLDLSREATLASDFVCSPLAVTKYVYCARVEGLFELAEGAAPRLVVPGVAGVLATELAATSRYLAWIADVGEDKLEVRVVELPR